MKRLKGKTELAKAASFSIGLAAPIACRWTNPQTAIARTGIALGRVVEILCGQTDLTGKLMWTAAFQCVQEWDDFVSPCYNVDNGQWMS